MSGGGLSRWPPYLVSDSGAAGSAAYAKQVDLVSDTVCYVGEAEPGAAGSDATWRIKRITQTPETGLGDDIVVEWADSNNNFDKTWDDRLTYSYG